MNKGGSKYFSDKLYLLCNSLFIKCSLLSSDCCLSIVSLPSCQKTFVRYFMSSMETALLVEFIDDETALKLVSWGKEETKQRKKNIELRVMVRAQSDNKSQRYLSWLPLYCNASSVPDKTSVTLSIIFVRAFWLLPRRERAHVLLLPRRFYLCFRLNLLAVASKCC